MTVSIPLGSADRLTKLYSFPNSPDLGWTLVETVKHWFAMTLERDGLTDQGATVNVGVASDGYVLLLDGPAAIQSQLQQYAVRLPQFLLNGENALNNDVTKVVADKKWDAFPDAATKKVVAKAKQVTKTKKATKKVALKISQPSVKKAFRSTVGYPAIMPPAAASRNPASIGPKYSLGSTAPDISFSNWMPSPRPRGSSRRVTSPNWPWPPVWRMNRPCAAAIFVIVSR